MITNRVVKGVVHAAWNEPKHEGIDGALAPMFLLMCETDWRRQDKYRSTRMRVTCLACVAEAMRLAPLGGP